MSKKTGKGRGFASMTAQQRQLLASMGGKASWTTGKAHRWTSEEARAAGSKGGRPRKQKLL